MQALDIDDFPGLMREWAEWVHNLEGLGYSDSTTIWRAAMGSSDGEFASAIPLGIRLLETHGALRRLINAMDALSQDDDTKTPVSCVQWLYLYGPEKALEAWGKSKTKFYEAIRTGEILIRREIKR
jgi:hypothetical protein